MDDVGAILITGSAGVVVAAWGVISQRAITRRRATIDLIVRIESDGDLIRARKKFIELAKADGGLAPWADEAKEHSEQTESVRLVLNTYELISIGIQRGVIEYEMYRRWFRSGTLKDWGYASPFIMALRTRIQNDALYHEFDELARWLKGEHMPRRFWWWGRFF